MRESVEKELKLVSPRVLTEADVGSTLEGLDLTVKWLSTFRQMDTYFDTADGILLEHDSPLRVRRVGKTSVGTFKLPIFIEGALTNRHEMEWQILSTHSSQSRGDRAVDLLCIPSDVNDVLKRLGVRAAAPVLVAVTLRHKGEAAGPEGLFVELSLDEVTFIGPRGQFGQYELELEHKAGDVDRLKWIGKSLIAQHGFQPSRSKFRVGMETVG